MICPKNDKLIISCKFKTKLRHVRKSFHESICDVSYIGPNLGPVLALLEVNSHSQKRWNLYVCETASSRIKKFPGSSMEILQNLQNSFPDDGWDTAETLNKKFII